MSRPSRIGIPLGVAPGDVVGVVQRRVLHDDAADRHRQQPGDRRERSGAADLDVDRLEPGRGALGGELVGERPARRGRAEAEPRLQVEPVDLVDHAVDVVAEGRALRLDGAVLRQHVLGAVAEPHQRIGREPELAQPGDRRALRGAERRRDLAPGIGEEAQRPRRADPRVELAQAAGGGVARVGEGAAAGLGLPRVQRGEVGMAHVGLAAHLEHLGRAGQLVRDVADGAGVGGHVLAGLAVAAGGGHDEPAALVAQRQRQPVDLRLGGEGERLVGAEVQEAADALGELGDVALGEGVLEAQHADRVPDLGEALGRCGADPRARAVGAAELGKARLDGGVAPLQRVIVGVADLRGVGLVVGDVGLGDRAGELGELLHRRLRRELLDRAGGRLHVRLLLSGLRIPIAPPDMGSKTVRPESPAGRSRSSRRSPRGRGR